MMLPERPLWRQGEHEILLQKLPHPGFNPAHIINHINDLQAHQRTKSDRREPHCSWLGRDSSTMPPAAHRHC